MIGKVIGKPDLQYRQITYDQFRGILLQTGASQSITGLLVEMSEALNSGYIRALDPRSERNTTATSYEQFLRQEFVPPYQATTAAVARA